MSESRVLDCFGPNLIIDTNGSVGVAGQLKYQLYSVTDGGVKYQQALYGNGLSTIDADGTLEITAGFKNKPGRASLVAAALEGDAAINAEKGWVRIKGRNVVIDATNELVLQATKIQIGHVQKGRTQDFQVTSTRVDLGRPKRGNMCKILKTCGVNLSFARSLTPFGGGGSIGAIAGGLVGGAVGGPVGAQIGSQVGGEIG